MRSNYADHQISNCILEISAFPVIHVFYEIADDASSPPDNASGFVSQPGERKPSSVEEEMAVVSLVRLCTGHHSDEATSSSTDQD